jgi:hypothetical protein
VPVVVAAEIQALAGVPRREDRAQRGDQFGHPGHRLVELRAEPLFDLGTDLGSEAKSESSRTQQLMVVGLVRQMNRVARERDCHISHQVQVRDGGRERQGREHVVRAFEGGDAARAGITQRPRAVSSVGQRIEGGEDFHGASRLRSRHEVD